MAGKAVPAAGAGRSARRRRSAGCWLGGAALTLAVVLAVYALQGYAPFGDTSFAVGDAYTQYFDFFLYGRRLLAGAAGAGYSFGKGLGGNCVAVVSYYLTSPLNLVFLLFDETQVALFYHVLVALKLALAGGFAGLWLARRFAVLDGRLVCLLAAGYGLCSFAAQQARNVMWLDGLYLLPLALLGVWRLVEARRTTLLSVTVCLALLFNWYAGAILCLFSALWLALEWLLALPMRGARLRAGFFAAVRYARAMALGIGGSLILFWPTVLALGRGRGSADWSALDGGFLANPLRFFQQGITLGAADNGQQGLVTVFCGSLAVIGAVLLFASPAVARRRKVVYAAFAAAVVLLYYWRPAVFLFSLLKQVDSYWYRYSHLGSAYLVFLGAAGLAAAAKAPPRPRTAALAGLGPAAAVLALQMAWPAASWRSAALTAAGLAAMGLTLALLTARRAAGTAGAAGAAAADGLSASCGSAGAAPAGPSGEHNPAAAVKRARAGAAGPGLAAAAGPVSAAASGSPAPVLREAAPNAAPDGPSAENAPAAAAPAGRARRRAAWAALALFVCGQLAAGAALVWESHGTFAVSELAAYIAAQTEQIDALQAADGSAYRVQQTMGRAYPGYAEKGITSNYNEGLAYGYASIASFTSSADRLTQDFLDRLGYNAGLNLNVTNTPILGADALLGVKYILSPTALDVPDLTARTDLPAANGKTVYESSYCLPMAFVYKGGYAAANEAELDPFVYQNQLFSQLLGREVTIYLAIQATDFVQQGDGTAACTVQAPEGNYLFYGMIDTAPASTLYVDGALSSVYKQWLAPRVFCFAGAGSHTMALSAEGLTADTVGDARFYALDLTALQAAVDELSARAADCRLTDGRVDCTVTGAAEGELLYLSVPWDAGWTVTCNGEAVTPTLVGGCMMAVPLPAGDSTVTLTYRAPGFRTGALATAAALAGMALSAWWERRRAA